MGATLTIDIEGKPTPITAIGRGRLIQELERKRAEVLEIEGERDALARALREALVLLEDERATLAAVMIAAEHRIAYGDDCGICGRDCVESCGRR